MHSVALQKIRILKEELDLLRLSHAEKQRLSLQREQQEIAITELSKTVETLEHTLFYQQSAESPHTLDQLKLVQKALAEAKQQLAKTDHQLDTFEEKAEQNADQLEENLALLIISVFPAEQAAYQALKDSLAHALAFQQSIQALHLHTQQLLELVQGVLAVRHTVKKQGILRYIFGRNPNQHISQHLEAIQRIISLALIAQQHYQDSLFEEEAERKAFSKLALDTYLDLSNFCKKKWSFKTIDKSLTLTHSALRKLLERLQADFELQQAKERKIRHQLADWISSHST